MWVSLWLHFFPFLVRPDLHRPFPLLHSHPLRSVPWARQPDRHGKPVQGERGRLRRRLLPHRFWAQRHGLQRAQQLPGFFLLRYTVIGPGHRRRNVRQAARRNTPRIRRLPQSGRRVSQSVVLVYRVRTWKPVGERNVDQSLVFGVTRNTYIANSKFSGNLSWESGR